MRDGSLKGPALRLLLAAVLALPPTLGCHSRPAPRPVREAAPPRLSGRRVRVVPVPTGGEAPPRVVGPVGRGASAGKGALAGAGGGALAGLEATLKTGALAPILAPILIPFGTLVGAAGGAVVGYADGIPKDQARALQDALERSRMDLCAELADRVARRLPAFGRSVPAEGEPEDLCLEVSLDQWGMFGATGANPMGELEGVFSFWVREPGGTSALYRRFVLGGARRPFSEWTAGGEALQREAMGLLLDAGADAVLDTAFLTHAVRTDRDWDPALCGLRHLEPPPTLLPGAPLHLGAPRVGVLTPVLAWVAFDPGHHTPEGSAALGAASDLSYDLRIWRSIGGGPGELVYERTALVLAARPSPDPSGGTQPGPPSLRVEHPVEVPLAPGTEYLWSVRARYRLDGEPRATRWSMAREQEFHARTGSSRWFGSAPPRFTCADDGIPPLHHHRFRTP